MSPIEQAARFLVAEHSLEDAGLQAIYWSPCDHEVRLVEVTTSVPEGRGVAPVRCDPDPPYHACAVQLIVLHPTDWARVLQGDLQLPTAFASPVQLH